jgi:hypothetical protein
MDRAHTKGPWEVKRSAHKHDGAYDYAISAPDALVLAEAFGRDAVGRYPEAEANAHLIAAAPDMYEALKTFVAEYVDLVESGDAGFWDPEKEAKVIAARSAIAKAEGLGQRADATQNPPSMEGR